MLGRTSIRGEAVILTKDFKEYFPDETTPRNIGNGILMRKTDKEDENKHLSFIAFDVHHENRMFINQSDKFDFIKTLGFDVVPYQILKTKEEILKYWEELNATRDSLPYQIDGSVLYIQNITKQLSYGSNDGRQKGVIAWKPTPKVAITKIKGVVITTGKTGAHIPTASLEPVIINGASIKSALLTTFDEIERLGLNIGDEVTVELAGDIIPRITSVITKNSVGNYPMPTACIACESSLVKLDAYLVCPNHDNCPGQAIGRIDGWLDKCGVKHLGEELLQTLFDGGVITNIVDLYKIDWKLTANLKRGAGRLGNSMATKIKAEIDKTLTLPITTFMGSLGLKFLGRRSVEVAGLKTVEEWLNLTVEEAAKLEGVGPTKAQGIVDAIQNRREEIVELLEYVKIKTEEAKEEVKVATDKPVFSLCLTGAMSKGRSEIKADLEALGHTVKDDVVSGLTYLVTADKNSTSSKSKRANKLNVKIISEEEMWALVN
jgi:DNA ligase (NAD+)